MITLGPEHYREAKSLLLATAALSSVVAIGLVGGGIYLAMLPPSSTTVVEIFGSKLTSANVGVVLAFLGAIAQAVVIRNVLATTTKLLAMPSASGLPVAPAQAPASLEN